MIYRIGILFAITAAGMLWIRVSQSADSDRAILDGVVRRSDWIAEVRIDSANISPAISIDDGCGFLYVGRIVNPIKWPVESEEVEFRSLRPLQIGSRHLVFISDEVLTEELEYLEGEILHVQSEKCAQNSTKNTVVQLSRDIPTELIFEEWYLSEAQATVAGKYFVGRQRTLTLLEPKFVAKSNVYSAQVNSEDIEAMSEVFWHKIRIQRPDYTFDEIAFDHTDLIEAIRHACASESQEN